MMNEMNEREYVITTDFNKVDFAPETLVGEILQNVKTIITTTKGSVPLDRSFGVTRNILDLPVTKAEAALRKEIIEAVRKYEPRAKITSVTFEQSTTDTMDGMLKPVVTIKLQG